MNLLILGTKTECEKKQDELDEDDSNLSGEDETPQVVSQIDKRKHKSCKKMVNVYSFLACA